MKKVHGMTGKRNALKLNGRRNKIMICLADSPYHALVDAAKYKGLRVATLAGDIVTRECVGKDTLASE